MTKAERMRELTNKASEQRKNEILAKHEKYANKIISEKARLAATRGLSSYTVKIKKRFSPTLTKDALEKHGFKVTESRKNGRSIFKLKW